MGETGAGEGIRPTRSSVEIKLDVGVVELLKNAEEEASTKRFKEAVGERGKTQIP